MAVCYHSDTPDSTGKELPGRQQRLNAKLNEVRRKCGKPGCACAAADHPGHGPQWNLTRKVDGRTRAVHLKPGPELEKARREVAEYERFRGLAGQVTEVNEAICQARPAVPGEAGGDAPPGPGGEKGGSGRPSRRRGPPI